MENGQNKPEEKKGTGQIIKEFALSSISVDNRTSVMILTFIIVLFGITSYNSMPRESFPEIVIPQIYIGTIHPGNSPSDMENLITRPIEKKLKSINGVKKITSTSIQDYSTIIVEFNPNVRIPKALSDVKDAVDKAKADLPTDLDKDPDVFDINFSDIPILNINLSGNFDVLDLKSYAEYLEDEIEKLPEISRADVKGTPKREIKIDADLYKMKSLGISFNDIENAIRSENITISGGNLLEKDFRRSVRVVGEFTNMEDIRNVIVKDENKNIVYLRDIADVKDGFEESQSYARSSLLPVVTVDIVKRSGENLVNAADKIKAIIEKAKEKRFPKNLSVTYTNDQSRSIRTMVSDLENNIISGILLVVGVLMFAMGLRSALMVGIAIPLSMFISFIILNMMNVTLNTMVLFSLILALGMLVDNGIVVIENIYRLLEEGKPLGQAVKEGVGEIAVPIISSTATTVAAFLPLIFWQGILGQFMRYLPITIIVVLSASLFVALVVNPALAMYFTKLDTNESKANRKNFISAGIFILLSIPFYISGNFSIANLSMIIGVFILMNILFLNRATYWVQTKGLSYLEDVYYAFIKFVLKGWYPYIFLGATVFLLFFSNYLLGVAGLKVLFFPENQPNYINVFIQKPIGTDIEVTNTLTKKIEERVIELLKPYNYMVEAVIAQVGEGTADPNEGPSQGSSPHKAKITVNFGDFDKRKGTNTNLILEMLRDEMQKYAGVQITVAKERNGPPVGADISIEVIGENFEKLVALGERIKKYLDEADVPGVEELKFDLETGKPEMIVHVDREKARRFGLSNAAIAMEIRTALFGKEISKYKEGEDDYPINLRLNEKQRYDKEALLNQTIVLKGNGGGTKQIPISSVAQIEYTDAYGSIRRKNLDRVITVISNVKEGYNKTEVVNQIKGLMTQFEIPEGFEIKFTGEQEEQDEASGFLGRALLLAIFMVFLIIVTQFNSLSAPLVIMTSVIFSTIGVFLGLVIFQMDFVILMMGIGIISLAGVVVNNAIVLIDYANLMVARRKLELGLADEDKLSDAEFKECIAETGRKRLRPVLLTAITTFLGLVPLAIGFNINFFTLLSEFDAHIFFGGENVSFWGPLSWTVIFGLTFATFLTLVIVPVMYLLAEKLKFGKKKPVISPEKPELFVQSRKKEEVMVD